MLPMSLFQILEGLLLKNKKNKKKIQEGQKESDRNIKYIEGEKCTNELEWFIHEI